MRLREHPSGEWFSQGREDPIEAVPSAHDSIGHTHEVTAAAATQCKSTQGQARWHQLGGLKLHPQLCTLLTGAFWERESRFSEEALRITSAHGLHKLGI